MTSDTSHRPVSPLRAPMIEDMTIRGFNERTRGHYVRYVRAFAAFIGRSPDTATAQDLRLFQFHQTQIGVQPPINGAVSALRFFFTVRLDQPDLGTGSQSCRGRGGYRRCSVGEVTLLRGRHRRRSTRHRSPPPMAAGCTPRKSSRSRSAISIPSACCCALSAAKAARTATRCCRRSCSTCCAFGGGRGGGTACCCREAATPGTSALASAPPPCSTAGARQ